ncbi:uncharacterized protein TrAtP1_004952 [Trichoderma atroviride]|uniref:uncharacterized protein n=1 Tax=Hypocrea atroviridis TaxID=63577 RepID=UPI0033320DAF|nr:hypothetical protein TrAtP1_004952 [Trichoderma atroviride]
MVGDLSTAGWGCLAVPVHQHLDIGASTKPENADCVVQVQRAESTRHCRHRPDPLNDPSGSSPDPGGEQRQRQTLLSVLFHHGRHDRCQDWMRQPDFLSRRQRVDHQNTSKKVLRRPCHQLQIDAGTGEFMRLVMGF